MSSFLFVKTFVWRPVVVGGFLISIVVTTAGCNQPSLTANGSQTPSVQMATQTPTAKALSVPVAKPTAVKANEPVGGYEFPLSAFDTAMSQVEETGDLPKLIAKSKKHIQAAPRDGIGYYYLAVGTYYEGDFKGAVAAWKKAAQLTPKLKPRIARDQEQAERLIKLYPKLKLEPIRLVPSDRIVEQETLAQQGRALFEAKKYDEIERIAAKMRQENQIGMDGMSKLQRLTEGFHPRNYKIQGAVSEANWQKALEKIAVWRKARPNSLLARIVQIDLQIDWAWDKRGDAFADKVTKGQWAAVQKHLDVALKLIEALPSGAVNSPYAGVTLLRWGQLSGLEQAEKKELWGQLKPYQNSIDLAYTWSVNLLPKWGGAPGEWEKFAKSWADRTPGVAGDIRYAQLMTLMQGNFNGDEFWFSNDVDWPRTQRGLQALGKKYPQSIAWATTLMRMAEENGDYDIAQDTLINRVKNRASMSRFSSVGEFGAMRNTILDAVVIRGTGKP